MNLSLILNKLNHRNVLFSALIIFLIPFFIFSCWNHPTSDDYIIGVKRYELGFWAIQKFYYIFWSGRYFSTFISTLFSYTGILYSHWYLFTASLLVCTFTAWLFTLVQLNRFVLNNTCSLPILILSSLLMLVLQLNVIPEVNTAFYWFSSAVTYQIPLLLLIIISGLIMRLFSLPIVKPNATLFLIFLLIFFMQGCNEMFSMFFLVVASWVTAFYLLTRQKYRQLVLTLYLWSMLASCVLFFAPGVFVRSEQFLPGSLSQAAVLAVAKFGIINWFFLKEPLWWFIAFSIAFLVKRHYHSFKHPFFLSLQKVPSHYWIIFYISSGLATYFPLIFVTNGTLPFRSENIICFVFSLLLLFIIYIQLTRYYNESGKEFSSTLFYRYRYLLFTIIIFSTGNMEKIAQSLFTGFFYNEVMVDRKHLLENGSRQKQHSVILDDYNEAIKKKLNKYFPNGSRQLIRKILYQKPALFFFEDNLANRFLVQKFYGIDTVIVR